MNKEVLVKEVMKTKPVIVQPFTTVLEAARLMKQNKIGNVIISEVTHPIGILTESDIIKKVVCEEKNAQDITVEKVMSRPLIIADPYISIQALKIMGKCNIRRLPLVENNELVGIITQQDILRLAPTVTEIMQEWTSIEPKNEEDLQNQTFSPSKKNRPTSYCWTSAFLEWTGSRRSRSSRPRPRRSRSS